MNVVKIHMYIYIYIYINQRNTISKNLLCFISWWVERLSIGKNENFFPYSQTEQTVIFVTLYYILYGGGDITY